MNFTFFIETLRTVFNEKLTVKTGYGRNEIKMIFEQSVAESLAKAVDSEKGSDDEKQS